MPAADALNPTNHIALALLQHRKLVPEIAADRPVADVSFQALAAAALALADIAPAQTMYSALLASQPANRASCAVTSYFKKYPA